VDRLLEVPIRPGSADQREREAARRAAELRGPVHERVPALIRRLGPAGLAVLVLLVAWELYAQSLPAGGFVLPAPTRIAGALWDQRDLAVQNTLVTLGEAAVGFLTSLALAILAAILMDLAPVVRRSVYPLLVGSQALPVLVVAPVLVLWLGFGLAPKVVVIVLLTFFPMVVGLLDGFAGVPAEATELMRSYGASARQGMRLLRWPAALPSFFTGLRIAVTYSVLGAVYAEYVGSYDGLGIWILTSGKAFRYDLVFGAVGIVLVLSVALFLGIGLLERLVIPWAVSARRGRDDASTGLA
jgi:ABC-type nitrate/sulfonate/bicarbonate transport system permease component